MQHCGFATLCDVVNSFAQPCLADHFHHTPPPFAVEISTFYLRTQIKLRAARRQNQRQQTVGTLLHVLASTLSARLYVEYAWMAPG